MFYFGSFFDIIAYLIYLVTIMTNSVKSLPLQAVLVQILQNNDIKALVAGTSNKQETKIEVYNEDTQKYKVIGTVFDGNMAYLDKSFSPEAYNIIFEFADKSIYDVLMDTYNKNIEFKEKYDHLFDQYRIPQYSLGDAVFYYNKRSKTVYAVPRIQAVSMNSFSTIYYVPSLLAKVNDAVEYTYKKFYDCVFHHILEKPLNQYTEDELIVFHMSKI